MQKFINFGGDPSLSIGAVQKLKMPQFIYVRADEKMGSSVLKNKNPH